MRRCSLLLAAVFQSLWALALARGGRRLQMHSNITLDGKSMRKRADEARGARREMPVSAAAAAGSPPACLNPRSLGFHHAAEKELLLTFRDGIVNWAEVQAAWGLDGWCTGVDAGCRAPVCTWGGVE